VNVVADLEKKGIQFKSLTDAIDTSSPSGRFFFHIMASLTQMEREFTIERTRAGLAAAKKLGRVGGRKRKMTPSKVESATTLLKQGTPPTEIARNFGVSVATLYRWIPASSLDY
jgi:DNA invertase Pin-like site-specific DNA recombinase